MSVHITSAGGQMAEQTHATELEEFVQEWLATSRSP